MHVGICNILVVCITCVNCPYDGMKSTENIENARSKCSAGSRVLFMAYKADMYYRVRDVFDNSRILLIDSARIK